MESSLSFNVLGVGVGFVLQEESDCLRITLETGADESCVSILTKHSQLKDSQKITHSKHVAQKEKLETRRRMKVIHRCQILGGQLSDPYPGKYDDLFSQ